MRPTDEEAEWLRGLFAETLKQESVPWAAYRYNGVVYHRNGQTEQKISYDSHDIPVDEPNEYDYTLNCPELTREQGKTLYRQMQEELKWQYGEDCRRAIETFGKETLCLVLSKKRARETHEEDSDDDVGRYCSFEVKVGRKIKNKMLAPAKERKFKICYECSENRVRFIFYK